VCIKKCVKTEKPTSKNKSMSVSRGWGRVKKRKTEIK
jgi:hypothetical protein